MKPINERTSAAMSQVGQTRTEPEERVARALREIGASYRRNVKSLPGKPDFANRRRRWVVQVHGCFWHQHDCKRGAVPTHNRTEWEAKFARNRKRDMDVEAALASQGFSVLTVWECETRDATRLKENLKAHVELASGSTP